MKRLAPSLIVLLAALGPARAGCGLELNCQIAAVTLDERQAWLEKVEQARRRSAAYVARAYAAYLDRNPPVSLARGETAEGSADYLHDPTLRRNDIVVTDEGVLVYKGALGATRSYSDFVFLPRPEAEKGILKGGKPSGPDEKDQRRRTRS